MDNKDFDTFDFLINDEDEVMLLLYQREGEPLNPHIELDAEEKSALLYRNDDDNIFLSDIMRMPKSSTLTKPKSATNILLRDTNLQLLLLRELFLFHLQ